MDNRYYKTKDLGECTALIVNDQRLINIERIGKTCWFIFTNSEQVSKISYEYFFGDLKVNARLFHQAYSMLKNRIFTKEQR